MSDDLTRRGPEDPRTFNPNQEHEIDAMIESILRDNPGWVRDWLIPLVQKEARYPSGTSRAEIKASLEFNYRFANKWRDPSLR